MDARADLAETLLAHRTWLAGLARALVGDAALAEDVVQDTLVAALERPPSGPLRPWLAAVVRRAASFSRRGAVRRRRREEASARDEATPSTDELIERIDTEERLVRELRALDEPFRTTLLQRFYEELPAVEIARRTGVPEGTVRWRTKRGLEELGGRLERAYGGRQALGVALLPLARPPGLGTHTAHTTITAGAGVGGGLMMLGGKGIVAGVAALALVAAWIGVTRGRGGEERAEAPAVSAAEFAPASAASGAGEMPAPDAVASQRTPALETAASGAAAETNPAPARLRVLEFDGTPNAEMRIVFLARDGAVPVQHRTDEHGVVELPPGAGEVVVERVAALPYRGSLVLVEGEQELTLDEGAVLDGRVVVDGAAPRRPLELELLSTEPRAFAVAAGESSPALRDSTRIRTDAEGRFRFHGLAPDEASLLRLPVGHARAGLRAYTSPDECVRLEVPRPERGVVLELERLPSVSGRLVEADGVTPAEGELLIRFTWQDGTGTDFAVSVGPDGLFEIFLEEPWRSLWVEYQGTGGRGKQERTFEREPDAPDGELGDLVLLPGRDVLLRVRDRAGRPIAGARSSLSEGASDAAGELPLVGVNDDAVRVTARGYREASASLGAEVVDVVLAPAPEVGLELRAAGGEPVSCVLVEVRAAAPLIEERPSMLLSAESEGRLTTWDGEERDFAVLEPDEAGRLRIDALLPGVPFQLRVVGQGGALVHEERMPALGEDERRTRTITLEAARAVVRGRVVDTDGAPVPFARLAFPAIRAGSTTRPLGVNADTEGRFAMALLDLPGLTVSASKAGFRPATLELARAPAEEVELVLERGRRIAVRVLDEAGQAVAGGSLSARNAGAPVEARAVAPGRFELEGLDAGPCELTLRLGGGLFRRTVADESEVELRVPAMGAVRVRWDAPEATGGWLALELRRAEGEPLGATYHDTPSGELVLDPVLPGEYELVLSLDDGALELARRTLTVRAGETSDVEL